MSNKALTWAWKMPLTGYTKLVLIKLADMANTRSNICWPSIRTLSRQCGIHRSSVIKQLNYLLENEYISKERRANSKGYRSTNMYKLNIDLCNFRLSRFVLHLSRALLLRRGSLVVLCDPNHKITNTNPNKEKESIKEKESQNLESFKYYADLILDYLNQVTNWHFISTDAILSLVIERMKEIIPPCDNEDEAYRVCCAMIDHMYKRWGTDRNMQTFLRPTTLFHHTKFHDYFGQTPLDQFLTKTEEEA